MSIDISSLTDKEKAAIVCLYFARLESDDPKCEGEYMKKLSILSNKYKIKLNTLKNNKDRFAAQFDNGRKGWHQVSLERQNKFLYRIYKEYEEKLIYELETCVEDIIIEAQNEDNLVFTIRTKKEEQVNKILAKEKNIEIDGLNILKDKVKKGNLIFIVLGGDSPAWDTGFVGLGVVSHDPYPDRGRNYKIKIDVELLMDKPIKRENLVLYKETFDIIGIGPITKWEPNQAISSVSEQKAIALMRAMLDFNGEIENELENIVGETLMSRIKGSTTMLFPQEVDYKEDIPINNTSIGESNNDDSDDFVEVYEPDIDEILKNFVLSTRPLLNFKNFINSQKNIIMTGPPGTGKTTLAEKLSEEALKTKYISGYSMTTAVSDWSTFDTIGGYMPDNKGGLSFHEGIFLQSIRENKWLIVDEINRAEVDKAFGHFFTSLSGKDVELQYKVETNYGEKNISIRHADCKRSYYDNKSATYYIGRNWRVIATMNTYDKNSLFALSFAFMRRFAFIYIPAPDEAEFVELLKERIDENKDIYKILIQLPKVSPKKLGAAVMLDLVDYLENAGCDQLISGICSLVIPQYEGLSLHQIKQLYKDLGTFCNEDNKALLKDCLCEFFDVENEELSKVRFEEMEEIEEIAEDESNV